jgi:class 3 adenylate cyclase
MFADVKGSMEMAERMDPEEWSRIMNRFFQILSDSVERFEGFVDKFTGDGIMALFGAPIAHEDHARRACYAALHVLDGYAAMPTSCDCAAASTSRPAWASTLVR